MKLEFITKLRNVISGSFSLATPRSRITATLLLLFFSNICQAEKFTPYYASIKSSEVNVRKGPNPRYQIGWVYKKKGEPVEVLAVFEHWNKIRDIGGDEGWVRTVMLSKKRSAVIIMPLTKNNKPGKSLVKIYRKADTASRVFANIEASKRVSLEQCLKQWCKIKTQAISGWVEKEYLWGVYANEEFK